ncbi:hypothetical protein SAMN05444166_6224 [Singulisphaera sp. GP187]|uniref:hypothetical protein n=1 Tax=Singulisphaera sp. GP187 TaxID=1882752 RepID=UPI00092B877E|nr:hypothetical protein [Singulisphaera sp. GP187]SIO59981.1 hypothetical protein SAMN05444166_6224 [Singulisphaera sp. GP187]
MRCLNELRGNGLLNLLLLFICSGCHESTSASNRPRITPSTPPQTTASGHEHKPGTHGGLIVPLDGAHFHVEAILTDRGGIRLLMLGENESRVQEVELQTITAYVRALGDLNSRPFELKPEPQPGDLPSKTSAFVGQFPDGLAGRPLVVVVPSLRIDGRRLRFGFETPEPESSATMPEKVADEEERTLYLTPGGKYTEADVQANGRRTASTKFAGFHASHDPNPAPGSRVCPITDTRASPDCSWIVGGKTYLFCCPPCVDEFIRRAKDDPESIREPETYVAPEEGPK